jgi:hypothetical protein
VGVLYDYFRAPDASTASAVLERVGGPMGGSDAPVLDAVDGKGIDPEVMMRTLQSLLTGVPYDELPWGEMLAMSDDANGPWIMQLSEELRDALADAQASRLPAVAEQWVGTEEFGTRRPRPRCCRSWARSPPWPVVRGRLVSACTAGVPCSRMHRRTTSRLMPAWVRGQRSCPRLRRRAVAVGSLSTKAPS